MNHNKNIKLNPINNASNILIDNNNNYKIYKMDSSTDLINSNNNTDSSQLVPAHTHTMTVNLKDDDGNIIPTTVTLNFFFTSHNPNDAPIYAEFTKLDNNNNTIYKTNFSFAGVEDMGLPIAAAILHGNNLTGPSSDEEDNHVYDNDIINNQIIQINMEDVFKYSLTHGKSKNVLRKTLNDHFLINKFNSTMSFEDIFNYTIKTCSEIEGLGTITFYDIANDICKFYSINIPHIYIIRTGTKKAIKSLNITKTNFKSTKFNGLQFKYITIENLKTALIKNMVNLDIKNYELLFENKNAAIYEEYLNTLNIK
jgi:hypothetical protein